MKRSYEQELKRELFNADTLRISYSQRRQEFVNSRQHQKSIKASATASVVSKMRRGVSHPSFTGVDDIGIVVNVGFTAEVVMATGVGNWRLLQAGCVPVPVAGVEVAFPLPADP